MAHQCRVKSHGRSRTPPLCSLSYVIHSLLVSWLPLFVAIGGVVLDSPSRNQLLTLPAFCPFSPVRLHPELGSLLSPELPLTGCSPLGQAMRSSDSALHVFCGTLFTPPPSPSRLASRGANSVRRTLSTTSSPGRRVSSSPTAQGNPTTGPRESELGSILSKFASEETKLLLPG